MTLIDCARAEAVKLFTTRSVWWTSGLFFVLSVAVAFLFSTVPAAPGGTALFALEPYVVVYGVQKLGLPILVVQAIMVVTTEYRYRVQSVTYLAVPQRTTVALAKLLVYGLYAAALTLVTGLVALAVGRLRAGDPELVYAMTDAKVGHLLWVLTLTAFVTVLLAQGVGLIVRHTAGAVALVLSWMMAVEAMLSMAPRIGAQVRDWLPFRQLDNFLGGGTYIADWQWWQSGLYFAACAAALWLIGLAVLHRRDA